MASSTGLSSLGYWVTKSSLSSDEVSVVRDELTMEPISGMVINTTQAPASFSLFRESVNKIYLPKFYGLSRYGLPGIDTLSEGDSLSKTEGIFKGALRAEQAAPIRAFLDAAHDRTKMGGILSLPCGFGKTVLALHILSVLGKRTLVVVHKDFLLNQWKERISQFLPDLSVGIIKAQTVDVIGKDIVIGSLQSLSMKEYDSHIFDGIGFLIIDECHRVGTEVFSRALHKTNFRYTLGISATVTRKDGMTKAFVYFLGDVLFKGARRDNVVNVRQYRYHHDSLSYCKEEVIYLSGGRKSPNISRMINNIASFEPRVDAIIELVMEVFEECSSRRILILSDRKDHLRAIKSKLDACDISAGFYWGGMKPLELAATEQKRVMCATYAYAAEGMDVPHLDTLILATPKSDVEQSCGRILRQANASITPLVIDIIDCFSLFQGQAKKRAKFYRNHGYNFLEEAEEEESLESAFSSCLI